VDRDDRRQTTDDRRQTTDDRRQTTDGSLNETSDEGQLFYVDRVLSLLSVCLCSVIYDEIAKNA
jgi:hypothetical protein